MESGIESVEVSGAGGVVCAGDAEVSALSDGELLERMTVLGRQRCRLDAMLAETAAEMHRRCGGRSGPIQGLTSQQRRGERIDRPAHDVTVARRGLP